MFPPSFISILFFSHIFNLLPPPPPYFQSFPPSLWPPPPRSPRSKVILPLPQVCSNPHRVAPTNRSARLGRRRDFTVLKTIPPRKFEQSVWWKDSTPLTNYFQSTGRVYVAEYTFSDCQFLSRRAPSFFSFLFPSYILFCRAVSPFTIPLFRGVEVVFSETRRWRVAVGRPSNRYLACRAQCHGVIRDFSFFRGRLEEGSFLIESPIWGMDWWRKGDFGFSIASPSFVLVSP